MKVIKMFLKIDNVKHEIYLYLLQNDGITQWLSNGGYRDAPAWESWALYP